MEKSASKRNVYLDLFKFLLCFFVISIHLIGKTYSHYPLYRIAVPMFFMISGYFMHNKDNEIEKNKAPSFIIRCTKYMLVGIGFYTIFELISCIISGTSLGWFFTTLFYEGNDLVFQFSL